MGMPAAFTKMLTGLGWIKPPDPGNTANAPADPPVQEGTYGFIQLSMFGAGDQQDIVNVPFIPPAYQDTNLYPVNHFGLSGLEGGGSTGNVPQVTNGSILYFDPATGQLINLGT